MPPTFKKKKKKKKGLMFNVYYLSKIGIIWWFSFDVTTRSQTNDLSLS